MRLLLLASEFPPGPGGIGTHAYQIARHLSVSGWDVAVLAPQDYASPEEIEAFNRTMDVTMLGVPNGQKRVAKSLRRFARFAGAITAARPHAVLASGKRAVWAAAVGCSAFQLPWIAVGHGSEFGPTSAFDRFATRFAFGAADAVICVSEYTRSRMKALRIPGKDSYVIYNGADDGRFKVLHSAEVTKFRQAMGLEGSTILLTVGRISERKGQEVVVRALPEVLKHHPETHYVVAGLPEGSQNLTRLAERLGVQTHVHVLGKASPDEVVRLMNACDLFMMTSRRTVAGEVEGFGIGVIEAALCGKASIVSAGSGVEEAVQDGITGRTVPEDDPTSTAKAIVELLAERRTLLRFGEEARCRALREFTWAEKAGQYDVIIRQLYR